MGYIDQSDGFDALCRLHLSSAVLPEPGTYDIEKALLSRLSVLSI